MESKNEILYVDYRKSESRALIQKTLRKLKPFKRYSDCDVPLEQLEKLVKVLTDKYDLAPQWIFLDTTASTSLVYSCTILKKSSREPLQFVHGASIYELFAKLALGMAIEARKQKKG